MADVGGNGELVRVLMAIMGELADARKARDAQMAEHNQRMAEHDQKMAEHDEKMAEWAAIMARINAQQREHQASMERINAQHREHDAAMKQINAELADGRERDRELAQYLQIVAVDVMALKGRVTVLEQRQP